MTTDELIAALEAAPVGTRELGVAVLEAVGCYIHDDGIWRRPGNASFQLIAGWEGCVVCDLNFRLPNVPEGWLKVSNHPGGWSAFFMLHDGSFTYGGGARTEALARIIAQLKAVLAVKGERRCSTTS